MMPMSCSIFGFASGFVIRSAGFMFVPTFLVVNLARIWKPPVSTDFACRVLRFWPACKMFQIQVFCDALDPPSPSDAVLTAAYSSLSAEDSATTCCFLVHTLRQCPPLMMTPADTDLRVALSPPQSASEYASSSPLCCQRNQHLALGFPTRYRPILLTRSMSRIVGFAIAQHTCIDANLRSGRSCDK